MTTLTQAQARERVHQGLLSMDQQLLDSTVVALVFELQGDPNSDVEAYMHEEIAKMPHEVQTFWMGTCNCHMVLG